MQKFASQSAVDASDRIAYGRFDIGRLCTACLISAACEWFICTIIHAYMRIAETDALRLERACLSDEHVIVYDWFAFHKTINWLSRYTPPGDCYGFFVTSRLTLHTNKKIKYSFVLIGHVFIYFVCAIVCVCKRRSWNLSTRHTELILHVLDFRMRTVWWGNGIIS